MENVTDILQHIGIVVAVILGIVSGAIYIVKSLKSTNKNIDEETIKTYKDNVEALTKRIDIIEQENRELHAQINQLIGENRVLKDTLNLRDPGFIEELTKGFKAMQDMLECLQKHDTQAIEIKNDVKFIKGMCEKKVDPILNAVADNYKVKI